MLSRTILRSRRVLRVAPRDFLRLGVVYYSNKKGFGKFDIPTNNQDPKKTSNSEVPRENIHEKDEFSSADRKSKAEESREEPKVSMNNEKGDGTKDKQDSTKKESPRSKRDKEDDDESSHDDDSTSKNLRYIIVVSIASAIGFFLAIRAIRSMNGDASNEIDWDMLRQLIANKEVQQINVVNNRFAVILLGDGRQFSIQIASPHGFEKQLELTQQELGANPADFTAVTYERTHPLLLLEILSSALPALLIFWLLKQSGSQIGGLVNKKKFNFTAAKKVTTTFQDVAGLDEAKMEIEELVDFLKDPKKYQALGAHIPKGCLLTGPPGVGKTLLAKATAGEAKVPFLSISGSDFVEIFVGVGPSRIRDMFKEARKKAPCIIFIDEIDAIGRSRRGGNRGGRNDERESTLNALLVEMDGFNTSAGVVVLAGTNRPDVLDKALLRPGRFDRQITLEAPPLADRIAIWMVHLKPLTTDPLTPKEELAKGLATLSAGFSGADIMNACNEAALMAARLGEESILMDHFEKALDRIVGGLEKKNKVLSHWERKVVAYHEAGHAIVGWFSEWVDPLLKVSIQPRASGALGFAQYLPKDKYIKTKQQLFEEMSMALGGRAAEKLIFEHLSTGASDDLQRVTKMAYAQVLAFGMSSEVGHVSFPQHDDDEMVFNKFYSRKTEQKIDTVVRTLVDEAYERTEKLLSEKKMELMRVAEALLQKEVLKTDDMVELLGERPYGMPDIYVAKKLQEAKAAKEKRQAATAAGAAAPPAPPLGNPTPSPAP